MVPPSLKQSPAERVLRGTTWVVGIDRFKISPPPKIALTRMVAGFSPPSAGAPMQKEVFMGSRIKAGLALSENTLASAISAVSDFDWDHEMTS